MKIYISLPITGHDINDVRHTADGAKQTLTALGHEAVTPFDICPNADKPYSYYMGRDIEALLECDAILLCSGWVTSKGCQLEHFAARLYDKRVLFDDQPIDELK